MDKTKATAAPNAKQLAAELAAARDEHCEAEASLASLRLARPTMILAAADEELEAHDRKTAKAERRLERASAKEAALVPALEKARRAEDEAERQKSYAIGRAACAEYRRIAEKEYRAAALRLATILRQMSVQADLAYVANHDLPEGAEPLDPNGFRQEPPAPKEGPEYEDKPYWIGPDGERYQAGPVTVNGKAAGGWTMETERVRKFKVPSWNRPTPRRPSLQMAVVLPGVQHDEADLWSGDDR